MKKFIACLGFMLMPFHISGAMEAQRSLDYGQYFDDKLIEGWTVYNNRNTNKDSRLVDYNKFLPDVIGGSNVGRCYYNGFYLSGTNVKDNIVQMIVDMGISYDNVYKLDLSYTQVTDHMSRNLLTNLQSMKNLSYLWLNGCPVTDKCIEILLETGCNIKNLSVRQTPLTQEGLTLLEQLCNKYPKLTGLGVGGHQIAGKDLCQLIKAAINVKNLSIQLSEDLKGGIIQQALYRQGSPYDNLDIFFPVDTTYKDFFTNNLLFVMRTVGISSDSERYKYKLYMEGLCKKGDFITVAKNIRIYSPFENVCVLDGKFFFGYHSYLSSHELSDPQNMFECYTNGDTITQYYNTSRREYKDSYGRYGRDYSKVQSFDYHMFKSDMGFQRICDMGFKKIDDYLLCVRYENGSMEKDSSGKIQILCAESPHEIIPRIKAALEDKTSKSIMNHKFYYSYGAYTIEREGPSYSGWPEA